MTYISHMFSLDVTLRDALYIECFADTSVLPLHYIYKLDDLTHPKVFSVESLFQIHEISSSPLTGTIIKNPCNDTNQSKSRSLQPSSGPNLNPADLDFYIAIH